MKRRNSARDYPRTARLNSLFREIVAEELERIDDERLEGVAVTSVVVDGDLGHAVVYYDHRGEDVADESVVEALDELRARVQRAVGRQAKIKRTPELRFEADQVLRSAMRIEDVLRGLDDLSPDEDESDAGQADPSDT